MPLKSPKTDTMGTEFQNKLACTRKFAFGSFFVPLILCVLLLGCKDGSVDVDDKLVSAFVEIRVIEQTLGAESPTARLERKAVLERYGFSRESFLDKVDRILADEKAWVPFQKAVVARLDSVLEIKTPTNASAKKK